MRLPQTDKELASYAMEVVKDCVVSQPGRTTAYKAYAGWVETGRQNGDALALANLLYGHIDRLASHLFSPSELRFAVDYENLYPKDWLDKGAVAARVVSREWERQNIDVLFGHGAKEALTYGSCLLKQLGGRDSTGAFQYRGARLVMPWQFGVYNESINELEKQEAFNETMYLNRHEVWRRVRNLPDAEKLYKRVIGNSAQTTDAMPMGFMHQVLSTQVLQTDPGGTQRPGGIVELAQGPNYVTLGPQVAPEMYPMHELWVRDDDRDGGEDWTTIQLIEPDILIAPLFKRVNLFTKETHPYTLIQPNYVANYFWGRSEIVDLIMLQGWLTEHLDDTRQLMGNQVGKLLAFTGYDGLTDEEYAKFRTVGYTNMPPGASVNDITPKLPEQLIPLIGEIIQLMDRSSGFTNILSGSGEAGVRAGVHADTLMKTSSPRLRDRSLLLERQCASAADTTLAVLEAKEARAFWTNPENEETEFLLSQLPDDRRIAVDSHSSSPIYADDHNQLLAWALKSGVIGPEDVIEDMPFAHKDRKIQRLKQREEAKKRLIEEHPEVLTGRQGQRKLAAVGG